MNDVAGWNEIKESLPIGTLVSGVVSRHAPFGAFLTIPRVPFDGLIQITDFKDVGRMTPVEYPAIGTSLKAVVLGFKETGRQIWLGVKPSQLAKAESTASGANCLRRMPVGLRLRPDNALEFFGIDEVNSLLRQGARVVEIEPSEAVTTEVGDTEEGSRLQLGEFSLNVIVSPNLGDSSD
jgi:hypothetical protein